MHKSSKEFLDAVVASLDEDLAAMYRYSAENAIASEEQINQLLRIQNTRSQRRSVHALGRIEDKLEQIGRILNR